MQYVSLNSHDAFLGGRVGAFYRAKMLAGAAATRACFQLSTTFWSLFTSDLDGATAPPDGSPNHIVAFGRTTSSLYFWKFHVDFTTPANSTLADPTAIGLTTYALACGRAEPALRSPTP